MWDNTIINLDEALTRVMGRRDVYTRWLDKFFVEETLHEVKEAFASCSWSEAHSAVHKLKGTAGNLAVKKLAYQALLLDEMIKSEADFTRMQGDYDMLLEYFEEASNMYHRHRATIETYAFNEA